jgi:NAD-reducing hydrogenase small subunit
MTPKPKLATVWLGGCSGCHMSFLDMDERLIELAAQVELLASPFTDFKDFPRADITLVEGAVANRENLEQIRMIRDRSAILVSFGDCAVTGNVTAMRNAFSVEEVIERSYEENTTRVIGRPGVSGATPALLDKARPVHEVVKVDYFLQGCPPDADAIYALLTDLLSGRPPHTEGRKFG